MIIKFLKIYFTLFIFLFSYSNAQNTSTLVIEGYRGNLKIEGYAGDTIAVSVNPKDTPFAIDKQDKISYFRSASVQMSEYHILVPYQTYLKIRWTDEGNIDIKKIKSGIELQSRKGKITLTEIKGWAFVQNDDGDIEADFAEVTPQKPISFTNITGNITLNIPEKTNAFLQMQNQENVVENDFETNINAKNESAGSMTNNGNADVRTKKYQLPKLKEKEMGSSENIFKINSRKGKIKIKKRF